MRISIFGMGHVGTVTAACLARDGHTVHGIDMDAEAVAALAEGRSPFVEPGLDRLIRDVVADGRLEVGVEPSAAAGASELFLICVGTPGASDHSFDTSQVERAADQIGALLRRTQQYHSIGIRSTLLPGTTEGTAIPIIERASGKRAGHDFGIAYVPEFMREGSAIADYDAPGATIIGVNDERSAERLRKVFVPADRVCRLMTIGGAELVKCVNNAWHALKISFANEVGTIGKQLGFDGHEIMDALCLDAKLNTSRAYLQPGFAFGGSCLPKDLRGLIHVARAANVSTPVLDSAVAANEIQIDRAFSMIRATGKRRIGMIGLGFKEDTDDLRESPLVALAERLLASGMDVKIYSPLISLRGMKGANLGYLRRRLPQIEQLLFADRESVLAASELIVVGSKRQSEQLLERLDQSGTLVVDLVRLDRGRRSGGAYKGICW